MSNFSSCLPALFCLNRSISIMVVSKLNASRQTGLSDEDARLRKSHFMQSPLHVFCHFTVSRLP